MECVGQILLFSVIKMTVLPKYAAKKTMTTSTLRSDNEWSALIERLHAQMLSALLLLGAWLKRLVISFAKNQLSRGLMASDSYLILVFFVV